MEEIEYYLVVLTLDDIIQGVLKESGYVYDLYTEVDRREFDWTV